MMMIGTVYRKLTQLQSVINLREPWLTKHYHHKHPKHDHIFSGYAVFDWKWK